MQQGYPLPQKAMNIPEVYGLMYWEVKCIVKHASPSELKALSHRQAASGGVDGHSSIDFSVAS